MKELKGHIYHKQRKWKCPQMRKGPDAETEVTAAGDWLGCATLLAGLGLKPFGPEASRICSGFVRFL